MAWRENEFPAAPKRPESSDQLGGMSAMAQKIQEVQEIKAVTEQVDEMVKATCANIDMLNKNISQMCEAMEIFKEDKQYFQEFINAKPLTFKVSEESLNEYTKTMNKQCMVMLDDIKAKIDSMYKEGEENIKKLEKRVKESTSAEGTTTVRNMWLYWAFGIFVLALAWGIVGFLLWYKIKYGTDGMNFLAWATIAAIASLPVYAIIKLIYDWKEGCK